MPGDQQPADVRPIFARIAEDAQKIAPSREDVERVEQLTVHAAKRTERLEESGVGDVITPEDFDRIVKGAPVMLPTMAFRTVQAWHECFSGQREGVHVPITVLYGMTGRGKTLAGAWLVAQEGGVYVTAPELRSLFSSPVRNENRINQILRARVALLDDLGTEENDAKAQGALWEFVNKRQGLRSAMTLITANLALYPIPSKVPEERAFVSRYDERIKRRIEHIGRFVEATGDDLRRRPA